MIEGAVQSVDAVLPEGLLLQWVSSFFHELRFLRVQEPDMMGKVRGRPSRAGHPRDQKTAL